MKGGEDDKTILDSAVITPMLKTAPFGNYIASGFTMPEGFLFGDNSLSIVNNYFGLISPENKFF